LQTSSLPYHLNSASNSWRSRDGLFSLEELAAVTRWFPKQAWYSPTPLHRLSALAHDIGIRELLVKDESRRMGLDAFKILGVSYAVDQSIANGDVRQGSILACATDGNHGRAVAHVARRHQLTSRIFIHKGASPARIAAIEAEGAQVIVVDGNYDDSVHEATNEAEKKGWVLISDTTVPGREIVSHNIMAGYTMLMSEAAHQWTKLPDLILVQVGVGGLAAAVMSWFLKVFGTVCPRIVSCEPETAACLLESVRAGAPVTLKGSLATIMAGLSCGTVSAAAWPVLRDGLDACVAIKDDECAKAVWKLAHPQSGDPVIVSGESGACGVAALNAIMNRADFRVLRDSLHLDRKSRVMVINTEGATDPESYRSLAGISPGS